MANTEGTEQAAETPAPVPFSTIEVRVGSLPGRIDTIVLNGSRKVKDALEGARLHVNGREIRVNGVEAEMETDLSHGDTVLLAKRILGNCSP